MSGARKGIPRFSGPSTSTRTSSTKTPRSAVSSTPISSSRMSQLPSRLPTSTTSTRITRTSTLPTRLAAARTTNVLARSSGIARTGTSGVPRTGSSGAARPTSGSIGRPGPSTAGRPGTSGIARPGPSIRGFPVSRTTAIQKSSYTPRSQVVNVVESKTGTIPKTSVKTVKTKKVETSGGKTKTTTTVTKSYKPAREGASATDLSPAGPSRLPPDVSVIEETQELDIAQEVAQSSSLEKLVQQELMEKMTLSPGQAARVKGSRRKVTAPPLITTDDGETVPATLQIHLDRTVERSPEVEYIKRYMIGTKVDESGSAKAYEYNIQQAEPGAQRSDGVTPLHELIEVKSTLSFAPGVMHKVSTTVYESTEPDLDEVSQLVEEEAREVNTITHIPPPEVKGSPSSIYPIKKKLQAMQLNPESVRILEQSVDLPPVSPDEAQEELPPEIISALMHTEERGLSFEAAPANVYNYLFPQIQDDLVITVKPVAPEPMLQVVVPEQIPPQLLSERIPPEIESVAQEAKSCSCRQPSDDIYASVMLPHRPPGSHNVAQKGPPGRKRYPILAKVKPPWNTSDVQPIMDLVGASPESIINPDEYVTPDIAPMFYHNEEENVLEYHLTPQPSRFTSNVQLRGSQKPSWFPGYFMALPDNIRVVTSPCDVLPAAWQAVQPDIFTEDSFLIIG